jgi:hypothetical protein
MDSRKLFGIEVVDMPYHDKLYTLVHHLWHEETRPATVAAHLCFMVVSSFALFLFVQVAGMLEAKYDFSNEMTHLSAYLANWNNFFINLLFLLIIIELSQITSIAYYRWRRENL